jgi:Tol biopolymer transport system component
VRHNQPRQRLAAVVFVDGTEILFASNRDGRELDVYATSLDRTSVRRLTTASGYDYHPAWRP